MKGLTTKQGKLVIGLSKGMKKQKAGQEAGYGSTPGSTSAIVTETLKNPKVQAALQPYLDKHNITIDNALRPVGKGLKATKTNEITGEITEDINIQLKASDRALKLLGVTNNDNPNLHFHQHIHDKSNTYNLN